MDLCRGHSPNEFLKKVGVGFGARDMTHDGSHEAKQAVVEKSKLEEKAVAASRMKPAVPTETFAESAWAFRVRTRRRFPTAR